MKTIRYNTLLKPGDWEVPTAPKKIIKEIIDYGEIGIYSTLCIPEGVKEIEFDGTNERGGDISYKLYGEELEDPKYEEKLAKYNKDLEEYQQKMTAWQNAEDAYREDLRLQTQEKEFEIYIKLKKIYEDKNGTN